MGIANSTSRSSSGSAFSAGVQAQQVKANSRQQQFENYKLQYEEQKKQLSGLLANGISEIGKKFVLAQREAGDDPRKQAAIEANYKKQLEDFKNGVGTKAIESTMKSIVEPMTQLGILPKNQAQIDMESYSSLFNTLRPDQQAVIDSLPKATEAQMVGEAEGSNINYSLPNGETGSVRLTDAKQMDALIAKKATFFKGEVSASSVKDLTPSGNKMKDLEIAYNNQTRALGHLLETSKAIKETPGAMGVGGQITEKVGGAASQVPFVGDSLQEGISKVFSSASPEKVKEARSKYKSLISQMIRSITNDVGRLSDQDREYAKDVSGNIESIISNPKDIAESVLNLTEIQLSTTRDAAREAGKPTADLSTEDGVTSMIETLRNGGFSDAEIKRIIKNVIARESIRGNI